MLRLGKSKHEPKAKRDEIVAIDVIQEMIDRQLNRGESGVIAAVDTALRHAVHYGASDIHFEPWSDCLGMRFRLDGVLHDVATIAKEYQERVVARIKVLAKLVVYQKEVPQDGRIDGKGERAFRVSTFPTVYGEKVVVRLLDAKRELLAIESLGFNEGMSSRLRDIVSRPQGVILLTGPSSTGKTTTIYALLREVMNANGPARHIVTIEDPVEIRLDRIAQTQVAPHLGFDFNAAMRSLLRQDPDVIMVGEIRDTETARTAIQAGLTGHLVISTIHSGTAAGVFSRLLDMGIEPFLLSSSLTGVLAQRLIRKNCTQCTDVYQPDQQLLSRYGLSPDSDGYRRGAGCPQCRNLGVNGRTAIGELLTVTDEIRDLVLGRPTTGALHEVAVQGGMKTLLEDGIARAQSGITTMEELSLVMAPAENGRIK